MRVLPTIEKGQVPYFFDCYLRLADYTTINLSETDFFDNTAVVEWGISDEGNFEYGTACASSFACSLNNFGGTFDGVDWTGASIRIKVAYGESGNETVVDFGYFYIYSHVNYGNAIHITAYDALSLLDKVEFTGVYPTTAGAIVSAIAAAHSFSLESATFNGYQTDILDPQTPMTHRQALQYVAGACGCFAWLDRLWVLHMTPYKSSQAVKPSLEVFNAQDLNAGSAEVDGVRIVAYDTAVASLYGSSGYALNIEGNPLIVGVNLDDVGANYAGAFGLETLTGQFYGFFNPACEVGDIAEVTDANANVADMFITNIIYRIGAIGATYICSMPAEDAIDLRPKATAQAEAAAALAGQEIKENKQWFYHDSTGAHVLGATDGYRTDIKSTGLSINDVSGGSDVEVASFGADGAEIGISGEEQIALSANGIQMRKNGDRVLDVRYMSALKWASASYTTGTSSLVAYIQITNSSDIVQGGLIRLNEIDATLYSSVAVAGYLVPATFVNGEACTVYPDDDDAMGAYWYEWDGVDTIELHVDGATQAPVIQSVSIDIVVEDTESSATESFTFGNRLSDGHIGARTVVFGTDGQALGDNSFAQGDGVISQNGALCGGTYNDLSHGYSQINSLDDRVTSDVALGIGNGSAGIRHDALTLFKDGELRLDYKPNRPLGVIEGWDGTLSTALNTVAGTINRWLGVTTRGNSNNGYLSIKGLLTRLVQAANALESSLLSAVGRIATAESKLTVNTVTVHAGTNVTINRQNVYTVAGICFVSLSITTSQALTGSANLVTGFSAPTALTDIPIIRGSNYPYQGIINTSGYLRFGASAGGAAGTYQINGFYKLA